MTVKEGIYIASKTIHAAQWREIRDAGLPVISTWIDEDGPGETSDFVDLWARCVSEASNAAALILYCEPDEILKGAWVECGAALASGTPVFAVGIDAFSVRHHAGIVELPTLRDAVIAARAVIDNPVNCG